MPASQVLPTSHMFMRIDSIALFDKVPCSKCQTLQKEVGEKIVNEWPKFIWICFESGKVQVQPWQP